MLLKSNKNKAGKKATKKIREHTRDKKAIEDGKKRTKKGWWAGLVLAEIRLILVNEISSK